MCGIAAVLDLGMSRVPRLAGMLATMNRLQAHRGPDGEGAWAHPDGFVGLGHRRLSIIDVESGAQPMADGSGAVVTFNGEIYNFLELRQEMGERCATRSDTEVLLHAYRRWGEACVERFRGMFAFALWDERTRTFFCARDRCGIKPLYYAQGDGRLLVASEIKALLPFLRSVETDLDALKDYLTFQFCLAGKTLFKGVRQLLPGEVLVARGGSVRTRRYWDVHYRPDFGRTAGEFEEEIRAILDESVDLHLRSDVPLGAYVSGGVDSGVVASLAARRHGSALTGFTGKFSLGPAYDESGYARDVAAAGGFPLHEVAITERDFVETLPGLVYHLDEPVAGPGSFPQFVVSRLASRHRKVVLGGQGGDEVFGGYARYLIAYFEQCLKAAIDGTMNSGHFIVTYESILPNLESLREYKPLLQEFWRDGLFEDLDRRYFRLIDRGGGQGGEVRWQVLGSYQPFETFQEIFRGSNVGKESYFDSMTHFDYKTLLPALLHVEDRVSMAHGLESRVPLLDHRLVELAATIPSSIKFRDGRMKHVFRAAVDGLLPASVSGRRDKMGFPVPLHEWLKAPGAARAFARDVLSSDRAFGRDLIDNRLVVERLDTEPRFGRKLWGLLCLELWQQTFHDRAAEFRKYADEGDAGTPAAPRTADSEVTS